MSVSCFNPKKNGILLLPGLNHRSPTAAMCTFSTKWLCFLCFASVPCEDCVVTYLLLPLTNCIMIAKCFEMEVVVSLPGFYHAYISSQCVGFSEPVFQAGKQLLLNVHALIMTKINFLEMTPK